MTSVTVPSQVFQYIEEPTDLFLALFPHRYDYIWAERPAPGERANWQTETRHPLSDRLLQQGKYLYGVRFGAQTQYLVLDIDAKSAYHPHRDRLAISRMLDALEPLGLVDGLACTSSYSGGIHLYIPFNLAQKTWNIAFAVQSVLATAGFQVIPGQLEIFPNPKLYVNDGVPNLYAAHRLPLQEPGSYLLDSDWQLAYTTQAEFVRRWQFVAGRNQVETDAIDQVVKQARGKQLRISRQAQKFLNDLNAEIERGWTGSGQTNRLLGRITMRSYIFAHILYADEPLAGRALVRDIVAIAKALPGYSQWCRHQAEIESRSEEWMRCIENSAYFPYGCSKPVNQLTNQGTAPSSTLTHNQQQEISARERIRLAIAALLDSNTLPAAPTARFKALINQGLGGATLYRHRDLWHPNDLIGHLSEDKELSADLSDSSSSPSALQNSPIPPPLISPLFKMAAGSDCLNATDPANHQSLLEAVASNPMLGNGLRDRTNLSFVSGSNHLPPSSQHLQSDDPILRAELNGCVQTVPIHLQPLPDPAQAITSAQGYRQVVEAIAAHLCRLGWAAHQLGDRLRCHFGKSSLSLLSDTELVQCLEWLALQLHGE